MKKLFKWVGIVLGGLLGLLVIAVVVLYFVGSAQLNRTLDVQAEDISIPADGAALARGEHLVMGPSLCVVCHGEDLSGDLEVDDPMIGTIYGTNITGLGDTYSDADFIRAIRHGVAPDGRPLVLMPSKLYTNLSVEDLGAMIGYLKTVPHTGENPPEPQLSIPGYVLLGSGVFGDEVFSADVIDHDQPFPPMPEVGANVEYGAYLAPFCTGCHGEDLGGQLVDPTEPESPWAPNLTRGGELAEWSEADFIQTMRTGISPHGHELDPEWMPWKAFAKLDDDELRGLWMYLQLVPDVNRSE